MKLLDGCTSATFQSATDMKSLPTRKILLYYSALASMFLTLSSFFSVSEIENAQLTLFTLPVTMFLFLSVTAQIKAKLLNEGSKEPAAPSKNKGVMIFFVILYLVLAAYGSVNSYLPKNNADKDGNPPESSTPLIFKTEDSASESSDAKTQE